MCYTCHHYTNWSPFIYELFLVPIKDGWKSWQLLLLNLQISLQILRSPFTKPCIIGVSKTACKTQAWHTTYSRCKTLNNRSRSALSKIFIVIKNITFFFYLINLFLQFVLRNVGFCGCQLIFQPKYNPGNDSRNHSSLIWDWHGLIIYTWTVLINIYFYFSYPFTTLSALSFSLFSSHGEKRKK